MTAVDCQAVWYSPLASAHGPHLRAVSYSLLSLPASLRPSRISRPGPFAVASINLGGEGDTVVDGNQFFFGRFFLPILLTLVVM